MLSSECSLSTAQVISSQPSAPDLTQNPELSTQSHFTRPARRARLEPKTLVLKTQNFFSRPVSPASTTLALVVLLVDCQ